MSAVFCVICSFLMFVSDGIADNIVKVYSSMGLVMDLYVAVAFPHVIDISALSICSVCM